MKLNFKMLFIYLIFMLILFTACNEKQEETPEETKENTSSSIIVVDYLGRKVEFSRPVKSIACGYAYTGHVVAMLGRGDDIVSVVDGLKRDKVLTEMLPNIKNLPVPFSSGTINVEELLNSNPDVVFLKSDTGLNESVTEKLDKLKIPYVVIDFYSIEEQINSISIIGKVIGEEEKAKQYVDFYLKAIKDTEEIISKIPQDQKVSVYHSVNEAVRTDIKESLPADWIKVAGGINVSINDELKTDGDKSYATLEQIYLWDPDLIIANEAGVKDYILANEQWSSLKCVKTKNVYQMPVGISRWGHPGSLETPLAIYWTAKLMYPEYFKEVKMEKITADYYLKFFNLKLNDEQINRILKGEGMRELKTK